MRIRKSVPNSPSSSFSSSSLTTNSLASSTDSSSSAPFHFPSSSSSPARCRGLDLLVKAIHQVTVGSAVGFPYIQKRVVRRRRRALCFDKLSITQVKIGKPTSSALGKESQRRRRSMAVPSKYQDSVLQSWRPKTARSVKSENEEIQRLEHAPPFWRNRRKLSKQLSMCETPRDVAWERRRRQILHQERRKSDAECLTDDDLNELKGCIELGFGFKEEEGQRLCNTLPALDLYFAVNRQYSFSPVSTPGSKGGGTLPLPSPSASSAGGRSSSLSSPGSDSDSWKICSPGENPEHVKTKLRHWAQAVACSVMQSY
nr:uncharacterized protein LOC109182327 [Ipomoea batatas]